MKNVNFKVPKDFHAKIKATAAMNGMSMTDLLVYSLTLAEAKLNRPSNNTDN